MADFIVAQTFAGRHSSRYIRKKIEKLGGEVCLETKLEKLIVYNGFVQGITYTRSFVQNSLTSF